MFTDKNEYFRLKAHSYKHKDVQAPESEINKVIKKVLQEESLRLKTCENEYMIVVKMKGEQINGMDKNER